MDKKTNEFFKKEQKKKTKKAYTFHSEDLKDLDKVDTILENYKTRFEELGVSIRLKDRRGIE